MLRLKTPQHIETTGVQECYTSFFCKLNMHHIFFKLNTLHFFVGLVAGKSGNITL